MRCAGECALATPVTVHHTHVRERRMDMRGEDKPAAKSGPSGNVEVVKRMDVLAWHFSAKEIERLVKLQMRYQTRPGGLDGLDVPITIFRLRFARWLFEHGQIGEDLEADSQESDWPRPYSSPSVDAQAVPLKHMPRQPWDPHFGYRSSHREHDASGYSPLLAVMSRLRSRLTRLSITLRKSEWPGR